jgi:TRAP transporter TAXI family solute receptor
LSFGEDILRKLAYKSIGFLGLAILLVPSVLAASSPTSNHYSIGTGSRGATFYPMIEALCRHINQSTLDFSCEAVATPGSAYNLRGIEGGIFDLALSQANLQYLASQGMPPFTKKHEHVRTVAPLHQEVFILAVLPGAGISRLADIKGKRINIGNVGSGSRLITERLFDFLQWNLSEFEVHSNKSADLPELLCNKKIDAAIYSTGHPNAIYAQLLGQCGVTLVNLWDEDIARFVEANGEYGAAVIPGGTYLQVPGEKQGFGVQVLLSAHRDLPAAHVAQIVQTLVERKKVLAESAPIYKTVDAATPIQQQVAPYHEGTRFYFQHHPRSLTEYNH